MDFKKDFLSDKQKEKLKEHLNKVSDKISKDDVINLVKTFEEKFKKAKEKLKSYPKFKNFIMQCELLYKVIHDWVKGEYELSWKIVGAIAATLLYVINPIDIIPDFIPILGFVDDIFIVTLCFKLVKGELKKYCDIKGLNRADYGLD